MNHTNIAIGHYLFNIRHFIDFRNDDAFYAKTEHRKSFQVRKGAKIGISVSARKGIQAPARKISHQNSLLDYLSTDNGGKRPLKRCARKKGWNLKLTSENRKRDPVPSYYVAHFL